MKKTPTAYFFVGGEGMSSYHCKTKEQALEAFKELWADDTDYFEEKYGAQEITIDRLQEEVLCAEITFPTKMQLDLGISNLTFKYDDVKDWIEEELSNADKKSVTFSIKFFMKTTKWIENLPEADI